MLKQKILLFINSQTKQKYIREAYREFKKKNRNTTYGTFNYHVQNLILSESISASFERVTGIHPKKKVLFISPLKLIK